ncbi:Os02g0795600 [Oryza sativa Japonica Group]|uniref:Os02g0795600 protein n=1 Tax=Oryza sativa subsp. japonica TaxID=39947 RepID=Q0DWT9_ORYSJ|nr:Os02g0795600 [Oryza sativa Japonica Group]|eukprot:NP_001048385.1 Os02g0795600 [Oryza sativa Japonica Group]
MKANNVFQVTLLLSYLLLTIGGKELKSINSREKANESLTSPQVNITIQAQDGDIYDCVDVNLQTTFKHPVFKDHKIQMEPSSFPVGLDIKSPLEGAVLQAHLSTFDCPIGTIPILHNNNMDNTILQRIGELASNESRMLGAGIEYWDEVYGIRGSIYVYDPKVKKDSQDLTASWIQISNLPKAAVGVGIGVGSCVSPSLSGDNFARFHIFWVRHMMGQKESMMDHDNEELKKGCVDHNCPGFVIQRLKTGGWHMVQTIHQSDTGQVHNSLTSKPKMEPSSFPIGMDIKSPLVGAISQAQLSTIDCPIGTIPIVRNNNLANMMVQRIGTLANDDLPMLGAGIEYWDEIYGMQASINVYEPSVKKDSKDVSASWIQISVVPKGTNGIGIGAGSCVYPRSGDSFARFHIRWDNEELNKSCSDHNCPGFMQVSHSVGLGGRINPISVYNGPQYVINVLIFKMEPSSYPLDLDIQSILSSNISESNFPDIKCPTGTIPILRHNSSEAHMPNGGSQEEVWPSFSGDNFVRFHIRWDRKTKDWWLARLDKSSAIGYRPLGYWPSKLFDTLQEKATYAFWGGWVRGPTVSLDPPPMGSGHFAKEGYRKAALVKGIRIANKDNNFVNPNVEI